MADETKPPSAAVVIYTAGGDRIKPVCPMCGEITWGKLVPPGATSDDVVRPMIPAMVDGKLHGMDIQLWVCRNCGFLWLRTGATDPKKDKE